MLLPLSLQFSRKKEQDIMIDKLVQHFRNMSNVVFGLYLIFYFHFFFLPAAEIFKSLPKHETGQLSLLFLVEWLPVSRLDSTVAPMLHDPHQPKS